MTKEQAHEFANRYGFSISSRSGDYSMITFMDENGVILTINPAKNLAELSFVHGLFIMKSGEISLPNKNFERAFLTGLRKAKSQLFN